ncbi:MAG: 4Fe-4S dicluster domain-containing protein [Desulfobacterales bacterium]|nr:4Fe-4S dicluster domain-containing protein [Desulfobacterales bacterium]
MELLESVKQAGVVGAGGAGFPTHVKLAAQAEYILLNGAECEPLLRVDQQLMAIHPDEIIQGLAMAGDQVGAQYVVIGIKDKHKKVIAILDERIKALGLDQKVALHALPDIYPAGDEQVLVHEVTGRVVPEGGIPLQVGCVVVNSETAMNIYHAAQGRAVTHTWLTLAGDIPRRLTLKVPVGTPIREVLALTGLTDFSDYAVIDGGPMMGGVLADLDGHVSKTSKGYILLKKSHGLIAKKTLTPQAASRMNKAACAQCRMCTDLCPRYLMGHAIEPHKMMRLANYGGDQGAELAQLCCSCNLCQLFSCSQGLYPRFANDAAKAKSAEQGIRYTPEEKEYTPREMRAFRLIPSKRLIARLGLTAFDAPAPVESIDLDPQEVCVGCKPHVGAPVDACVAVGDRVDAGMIIGDVAQGNLGAPIHASISGQITRITPECITIRKD